MPSCGPPMQQERNESRNFSNVVDGVNIKVVQLQDIGNSEL